MRKVLSGAILSLVLLAVMGCSQTQPVSAPDFRNSVLSHLKTVETRDFSAFKSTLTSSNDLNVIFPGGTMLADTQAVLDFHESWFEDEAWIFQTEIVKLIEGSDQSTALVKYKFQDNAEDDPREAWLVLTFQLEANQWRLIHDQNTRISQGD